MSFKHLLVLLLAGVPAAFAAPALADGGGGGAPAPGAPQPREAECLLSPGAPCTGSALLRGRTFVVRGSALEALNNPTDAGKIQCIMDLMKAVDEYVPTPKREVEKPFLMPIEDVFSITGRGTVGTGRIERGACKVGDEIEIVGIKPTKKSVITGIEMFRKLLDDGQAGDNVGLLLRGVDTRGGGAHDGVADHHRRHLARRELADLAAANFGAAAKHADVVTDGENSACQRTCSVVSRTEPACDAIAWKVLQVTVRLDSQTCCANSGGAEIRPRPR